MIVRYLIKIKSDIFTTYKQNTKATNPLYFVNNLLVTVNTVVEVSMAEEMQMNMVEVALNILVMYSMVDIRV